MYVQWGALLLGIGLLGACSSVPTGPGVMVWPAPGRPFESFQVDESACRQYAKAQVGTQPSAAAGQSTATTATVGTVMGAAAGALIGAATGSPAAGAAIGAGSGLVLGTATGAQAGVDSRVTLQSRYDMAYLQCMYAKGHQVPGVAVAAPVARSTPAPPTPNVPPPPPDLPPPPPPDAPPAR